MSSGSFKNKTNGGNRLNYSLKILAIRQVVALVIGWATAFLGQRYGVDAANSVIQNGWQFAVALGLAVFGVDLTAYWQGKKA